MTNRISIRLAAVNEHAALDALQRHAALANEGDREILLENSDAIELPVAQILAQRVFVAERDGAILGFAALAQRFDGEIEIDGLFVEPGAWRQGIGRLLVDRSAQFASTHGSNWLHVVGNPHAAGFYAACGFEKIGALETRFGVGFFMKKRL